MLIRIEEKLTEILLAMGSHRTYHDTMELVSKAATESKKHKANLVGPVVSWLALLASIGMSSLALFWR